jgi:hypothetical protein
MMRKKVAPSMMFPVRSPIENDNEHVVQSRVAV